MREVCSGFMHVPLEAEPVENKKLKQKGIYHFPEIFKPWLNSCLKIIQLCFCYSTTFIKKIRLALYVSICIE